MKNTVKKFRSPLCAAQHKHRYGPYKSKPCSICIKIFISTAFGALMRLSTAKFTQLHTIWMNLGKEALSD